MLPARLTSPSVRGLLTFGWNAGWLLAPSKCKSPIRRKNQSKTKEKENPSEQSRYLMTELGEPHRQQLGLGH